MKKYWYTLLLTLSLLIAVTMPILPSPFYGAASSVFRQVRNSAQETVKNICAELLVNKHVCSNISLAKNEQSHEQDIRDMVPIVQKSPADKNFLLESPSSETTFSGATDPNSLDTSMETEISESQTPNVSPTAPSYIPQSPDFTGVLFIGDSRTMGLSEYGDLGNAEVFANSGMSVFNLFESTTKTKSGKKQDLEEVLSQLQYHTIYLMLGINELGYEYSSIIRKYQSVVDTLKARQPNAVVVLEANLHVTAQKSASSTTYTNEKINQINSGIRDIAENSDCFYIDVNSIFDDESGALKASYSADGSHVLGKYYSTWADWLKDKFPNT